MLSLNSYLKQSFENRFTSYTSNYSCTCLKKKKKTILWFDDLDKELV